MLRIKDEENFIQRASHHPLVQEALIEGIEDSAEGNRMVRKGWCMGLRGSEVKSPERWKYAAPDKISTIRIDRKSCRRLHGEPQDRH